MINIEGTSLSAFAFHIQGNNCEEELCLILSPSQACSSPIVVIAASVDGGIRVMHHSVGSVPNSDVPQLLIDIIMKWATRGVPPTVEQKEEIVRKAIDALNQLLGCFGFGNEYVGIDAEGKLITNDE